MILQPQFRLRSTTSVSWLISSPLPPPAKRMTDTTYSAVYDIIGQLYMRKTALNIVMPFIRLLLKAKHSTAINTEDALTTQQCLLAHTAANDRLNRYPLPLKYRHAFLSQLIRLFEATFSSSSDPDALYYPIYELLTSLQAPLIVDTSLYEGSGSEGNDALLTRLAEVLSSDATVGFVTHQIGGRPISLLETNQLVASGTTGFRTWPAALHLAEYLLQEYRSCASNIAGKRVVWDREAEGGGWNQVLELGAGSGLLGISLLQGDFFNQYAPHYYTFTDHNEAVLERIQLNLLANGLLDGGLPRAGVHLLDWCQPPEDLSSLCPSSTVDLILAADVVFDPVIVSELVKTLAKLMKTYRDPGRRRPPDCLICCAERNIELLQYFEGSLLAVDLKGEVIHTRERPKWVEKLIDCAKMLKASATEDEAEDNELFTGPWLASLDADSIKTRIYRVTMTD